MGIGLITRKLRLRQVAAAIDDHLLCCWQLVDTDRKVSAELKSYFTISSRDASARLASACGPTAKLKRGRVGVELKIPPTRRSRDRVAAAATPRQRTIPVAATANAAPGSQGQRRANLRTHA
jgi:hypothetical protein